MQTVSLVKIQHFNRNRMLHRTKSNNWLKMHGIPKRTESEMRILRARMNHGLITGQSGVGKSFHHLREQLYNQICEGKCT